MKRDLDLVRELLLAIEASPTPYTEKPKIPDRSIDDINYHLALMIEAGLVHGHVSRTLTRGVPDTTVDGLTWQGHEFIEAARDSGRWQKAKDKLGSGTGALVLDLVKQVLLDLARKSAGL